MGNCCLRRRRMKHEHFYNHGHKIGLLCDQFSYMKLKFDRFEPHSLVFDTQLPCCCEMSLCLIHTTWHYIPVTIFSKCAGLRFYVYVHIQLGICDWAALTVPSLTKIVKMNHSSTVYRHNEIFASFSSWELLGDDNQGQKCLKVNIN